MPRPASAIPTCLSREILAQLTGDVDGKLAQGAITAENARRLQGLVRWSVDALVEFGPDLVNILVPGSALIAKAGKFVLGQVGWTDKLKKLVESRAAQPGIQPLEQSHIFEQTTKVLKVLADKEPLVLVLDDLQWADAASISLLFHLGRRLSESRILVLGAYRGEEVQLGRGGERHPLEKVLAEFKRYLGDVFVDLDQAEKNEAGRFVDDLLDSEPNRLDPGFRQALVRHTGGHPLFAVELLRDMRERGDLEQDAAGDWTECPNLDWNALPPRVEGVIEERIGRLQQALQETLTVGSVEGEAFTAEVIARVRTVDERGMVRELSGELDKQHQLVASQGIRRLGAQALSSYRFRHSLFQKYLYQSLDAARRTYLHEDVGNVLEALYGPQAAEIAVQLARHFEEAGLAEKAIHYLRLAAEQAMRISANTEAIGHLSKALALLQALPATAERDRLELPLQMDLSTAWMVSQGFAAPGMRAALDRARELCLRAESAEQLIPVLHGLYTHYVALAEYGVSYELAQYLLNLAQRVQDPEALLIGYKAVGQSQHDRGDFAAARGALEAALQYHDHERARLMAFQYGEAAGFETLLFLGHALLVLGYPDQGLARFKEGLALAESLDHPHTLAYGLYGLSSAYLLRGDSARALELSASAIALCREKGIPFWHAAASINHGHALLLQGHASEGIAEATQGLSVYRAIGARAMETRFLRQLAEMYLLAGQTSDGLAAVSQALAAASATGERMAESELYQLRGVLLRRQGLAVEAEADLRRALDLARSQQAKLYELRAVVSMARLWRRQGKDAEARQSLAEIYGWFTEGFDTADLQSAKALLQELDSGSASH